VNLTEDQVRLDLEPKITDRRGDGSRLLARLQGPIQVAHQPEMRRKARVCPPQTPPIVQTLSERLSLA
jgi:hypothetical protein